MINTLKKIRLSLTTSMNILIVALTLTAASVKADDTEIYISSGNTANVLLVFDLSGSMSSTDICDLATGVCQSRYQTLIDSLTSVLNSLKDKTNLRIGLSMYGVDHAFAGSTAPDVWANATGIRWPIRSITEDASLTDATITQNHPTTGVPYKTHEIILNQLSGSSLDGATAIVDALYEATLYFKGDQVSNGSGAVAPPAWDGTSYSGGLSFAAHPQSYTPVAAWNAGTGTFDTTAKYVSPITNSCDNNYIVLLSDGEPTINKSVSKVESLIGSSCAADLLGSPDTFNGVASGKCGPELVTYLANTNIQAGNGITPSKVITHTIGFAVDGNGKTYLQNLAALGGGNFFPATDANSLVDSLTTILTTIAGENESFSGLSTSIKASSLSSDSRVFINLFKPSGNSSWTGNTKGYFIDPARGLLDVNDNEAIDSATGAFKDSAQSFWSSGIDGNNVDQGGLSNKLSPATRNIYTYKDAAPVPLSSSMTKISTGDATLPATLFNAVDDTEKDVLIDWLHNAPMGDTLHANAVTIPYSGQKVLFTMTNQGLLHAFDVTNPTTSGDLSGGSELFAFIPQSLLPNIKLHKANQNASGHLYGLDGSITYWHDDTDNNRTVNGSEKVYLYFGMRRGGNQYFALDVTNPSVPKLVWRIDGGTAGFTTLGQTWSRPVVTTINWNSSANKKVVIFGGGYNVAQDGYTNRTVDTIGNGIYVVDASTGTLLWSTGTDASHSSVNADMKYSIPSDLTVIDSDDDRHADRIYFGDMGGQIWRIDLTPTFGSGGGADAFRLADFAVNSETTSANFRRFYMSPSVAQIRDGGDLHYAVALGSGMRAHPTSTGVNDRFYMIKDTGLYSDGSASGSWTMLTEGDLYDATSNLLGEGTAGPTGTKATAQTALDNADGWYLKLTNNGEKVISPSLIFNFGLAFTTYTPASTTLTCGTPAGNGRLYLVNLKNATPVKDLVADSNLKAEDRSTDLPGIGIPTTPIPYFPPEKGHVDIFIGKEKVFEVDNPMARINWKVIE